MAPRTRRGALYPSRLSQNRVSMLSYLHSPIWCKQGSGKNTHRCSPHADEVFSVAAAS